MKFNLSGKEQRVLGCLLEKEITTPDQYPLSLNGLTNACNQKSNREPVMALSESNVQDILSGLKDKHLIAAESGFGSRVIKYRHRFCNTEFGELTLSAQELGILCVMMLRGAQTLSEIRTRTNRLCEFSDIAEVEQVLRELMERSDGPFVVMLERVPGKRESRYTHLLGDSSDTNDEVISPAVAANPVITNGAESNEDRIAFLELRVDELEKALAEVVKRLD